MTCRLRAINALEGIRGATQEEDRRHLIARQALVRLLTSDEAQWRRFCEVIGPHSAQWEDALRAGMYYVENILELDAPWLAFYLAWIYFHEANLRAMSEEERQQLWLSGWQEYEPPAPALPGLPEGWADGLTAEQARARLLGFTDQVDAALAKKPRGWLRADLDAVTRERVDWWYRHEILGQSYNGIATAAGRERVDVRSGIEQAHHWLFDAALVRFTKFKRP
jgi:hypothetical protein